VRRTQWAALAGAAVLLGGAFLVREDRAQPGPADPDLAPLREAAALAPCPPGLGPDVPALVLPCLGGGPDVDLRAAPPGRPTLVNVWATWCPPCVEEVPDLVAFADEADGRVGLVGVLTQDPERNGLEFARQFGMRYPSLVDDQGEVFRAFRPGPPVTLFLDARGRVVHKRSGKFTDVAEIEALVAEHLGIQL
jgi:thiol-disulfide isomerase/thioredoxin